ncbi:MAG: hypothetical protein MI864_15800 [Pseudomonadales bacterium]|nr:hypothetical protein [Pseudomonadales bacterium]
MKFTKLILLVSTSVFLSACGGGGGDSSSGEQQSTGNPDLPETRKLVFKFAENPLHPRAFNLAASTRQEENEFYPGDTISLIWDVDIYYTDNSTIGFGEQYLYDAEVYLSADDAFQETEDLKLFSIECSLPFTSQHACGDAASFQCVYAEDNQNIISCSSIPLGKEQGFSGLAVDTTEFLDVVLKPANVIFQACLRDEPDLCTEAIYPIQLN